MKYEIHDSHGVPQCGCEITRFDNYWNMEDYLEEHPDVYKRIEDGYATIVEVPCIEKFVLVFVRRAIGNSPRKEEIFAIIECDETDVAGICDEFGLGPNTYTTYRRYNGEKIGEVIEK